MVQPLSSNRNRKPKHITDLPTEIQEKILEYALQGTEVFIHDKSGGVDLRPTREILHRDKFERSWHWPDACEWQNAASAYEQWADILRDNNMLFYRSCTLVFIKPKAILHFLASLEPSQLKVVQAIELRPLALDLKFLRRPGLLGLVSGQGWTPNPLLSEKQTVELGLWRHFSNKLVQCFFNICPIQATFATSDLVALELYEELRSSRISTRLVKDLAKSHLRVLEYLADMIFPDVDPLYPHFPKPPVFVYSNQRYSLTIGVPSIQLHKLVRNFFGNGPIVYGNIEPLAMPGDPIWTQYHENPAPFLRPDKPKPLDRLSMLSQLFRDTPSEPLDGTSSDSDIHSPQAPLASHLTPLFLASWAPQAIWFHRAELNDVTNATKVNTATLLSWSVPALFDLRHPTFAGVLAVQSLRAERASRVALSCK